MTPPFHLAYPVTDLDEARMFFTAMLGAKVGRSAERWVDLNLFGHQISLHLIDGQDLNTATNPVDGDQVPIPHFGVVLEWQKWHDYSKQLKDANARFRIEPRIRFQGEVGEQATFFIQGPCQLVLEFKAFKSAESLFASD